MATLNVPIPIVSWPPPSAQPELEGPVQLGLNDVTYTDGASVVPDHVLKLGAFVYRLAGGAEEIWNDGAQEWQPAPSDPDTLAALAPLPFAFKAGEPLPWQGVLVAAGQKDKAGDDRFAQGVGGIPRYRLRAFARTRRETTEHTGLSGVSTEFSFVRAADAQRFAVVFDTDTTTPRDCTRARIHLKDAALVPAGYLEFRAVGREVELASCDTSGGVRARIVINADGDILLEPAPGRRIVLGAELEAERIHYLPANSSIKAYLVV